MFLTLLKRYHRCSEVSTPFQFLSARLFASKSGSSSKSSKKKIPKKNQEMEKSKKEDLGTAKEYIQRVKKSGKQIYKGVKDVVTGTHACQSIDFVGKDGKASSSKKSGDLSGKVPPGSVNKYSSKQAAKEVLQGTSKLVKQAGKKVMGGVGNPTGRKKGYENAVDTEKIKELGKELMKRDE